jgi:hypothetical protein
MSLHIAPIVLHIRCYAPGIAVDKPLHDMSDPYYCHLIAIINDLGIARIEGLDGRLRLCDLREIFQKLRGYGVLKVEWRHRGVEKFRALQPRKII